MTVNNWRFMQSISTNAGYTAITVLSQYSLTSSYCTYPKSYYSVCTLNKLESLTNIQRITHEYSTNHSRIFNESLTNIQRITHEYSMNHSWIFNESLTNIQCNARATTVTLTNVAQKYRKSTTDTKRKPNSPRMQTDQTDHGFINTTSLGADIAYVGGWWSIGNTIESFKHSLNSGWYRVSGDDKVSKI